MITLLIALLLLSLIGLVFGRGYSSGGWTLTWPLTAPARSDLSPHVPDGAVAFIEFNWGRWMRPVLKPASSGLFL